MFNHLTCSLSIFYLPIYLYNFCGFVPDCIDHIMAFGHCASNYSFCNGQIHSGDTSYVRTKDDVIRKLAAQLEANDKIIKSQQEEKLSKS